MGAGGSVPRRNIVFYMTDLKCYLAAARLPERPAVFFIADRKLIESDFIWHRSATRTKNLMLRIVDKVRTVIEAQEGEVHIPNLA
jgi:hypothetical protein